MRSEVPCLVREVLHRHVLELRSVFDEELHRFVRVSAKGRSRRYGLLHQREARAGFGDDEDAPEERTVLDRIRRAYVERFVEHDVLRDDDEQAVLPECCVVRGELLFPPNEGVQPLVCFVERRERDFLRHTFDLDAGLGDRCQPRHLEVEHSLPKGQALYGVCPVLESVWVEAAEVREPPVFLGRVRKRQLAVALEGLSSHAAHTSGGTSHFLRLNNMCHRYGIVPSGYGA